MRMVLESCLGLNPMVDENLRVNCLLLMLFCLESSVTENCPLVSKMVSTVDFTILSIVFLSVNRFRRNASANSILSLVLLAFKMLSPNSWPYFPKSSVKGTAVF